MKIKRIEGDLRGWEWNEEEQYLGNPTIGRIQLVSVLCDNGKELYQQPVWLEQRGEVNIIVNDSQRIAFIEAVRHAVIPLNYYLDKWNDWRPLKGDTQMRIPNPTDLEPGVTQLEIPRGFTNVILREAEEEAGYKVEMITGLGNVNPNTAFFGTSPFVYLCKATTILSEVPPDPHEVIRKVVWLTPEEAREVETLCGFTFSSLFLFRRWALKQEDKFWRDMGKRL